MALLGANGAGKTTTLKAISNLLARRTRRSDQGRDPVRGRARRPALAQRPRAARRDPGDGGPPLLRPSHDRRKSAHRRLHAPRRPRRGDARPRAHLRLFSAPQGTPRRSGRLRLGRRTADVRDRPGDDVAPQAHPARRAVDGARAPGGRGDFRHRPRPQRAGGRLVPARRAERQYRASTTRISAISWRPGASCSTARPRRCAHNEDVREFYLGVAGADRRSFKTVKTYKRRKRWLA